jgi:hypothetical protein
MSDFVHFWQFFSPRIHILAAIDLKIGWMEYLAICHIKVLSMTNMDICPSYGLNTAKFCAYTHIWA